METIQVNKTDFNKILNTAEILIEEVEQVLSQDEVAKKRTEDIKAGRVKGRTEEDLDNYLKKRGVKIS